MICGWFRQSLLLLYSFQLVDLFSEAFQAQPKSCSLEKKWFERILVNWYCAESLIAQNRPASHLSQAKLVCVLEKRCNKSSWWPGSRFYELKTRISHWIAMLSLSVFSKINGSGVFLTDQRKKVWSVLHMLSKQGLAFQCGISSQLLVEVSVSLQFSWGFTRSLRFLMYSYLPWFLCFRPQGWQEVFQSEECCLLALRHYTHLYHQKCNGMIWFAASLAGCES